jgi:imidazolonepropionase
MTAAAPAARLLVRDLAQLASPAGRSAPLRGPALGDVDVLEDAFLLCEDGRVSAVGRMRDLAPLDGDVEELDGRGLCAVPGLVDCHTHPAFAGDRVEEFALRAAGASYEELHAAGGGILSTVRATRAAGADGLRGVVRRHRSWMLRAGTTTWEGKSGYGLDRDTELRMLEVARTLGRTPGIEVRTSYLGAHALPREYADDRSGYLELVCERVLPEVAAAGLADAVDAFCERIAFTPEEVARVFAAARQQGLPVKLHADQLSDLGGAALAARYGALSADHLEYTSEAGVAAMAAAGTVAVLLPGAFYTLRETRLPPIEAFRRHGVPIALATDCNPGSSPLTSLLAVLNLACTLFRLTPEEALAGVTRNAAQALGLADRGTLEVGKRADLALWRIGRPAELSYWLGHSPLEVVLQDGRHSYPEATR